MSTSNRRIPPYLLKKIGRQQANAKAKQEQQFVIWDGEGADGNYILFGCVTRDEFNCIDNKRLSSLECMEFLLEMGNKYKGYIHCGFAFTYDIDHILRDVPIEQLDILLKTGIIHWEEYRIEYIPKKIFTLSKRGCGRITIYDTFSFFSTSLIKACKEYIPNHYLLEQVSKGKDKRSNFKYEQLHSLIKPYWLIEGQLMVALMEALRKSLVGAGIYLTSWHGTGAIANALIKSNRLGEHIKTSRALMPYEVSTATDYAFFGGHIELFQFGYIPGPIYDYDMRSAYPAALSVMPGLTNGEWKYTEEVFEWGIYRAHLKADNSRIMGPLPCRAKDGTVSYGWLSSGFWFGHEIKAAILSGYNVEIEYGWIYEGENTLPFHFIKEVYEMRAQWKREGNPAQLAAKLGMNSIYGKLAQTVGWDEKAGEPPAFHQQWYAGHITSWARSRLFMAMNQKQSDIIAVETDGIYSRAPLNLPMGQFLGQWECTVYDAIIYVQNGVYLLQKDGKWFSSKRRGVGEIVSTNPLDENKTSNELFVDRVIANLPTLEAISTNVYRYGALTGFLGKENHFKWYNQERVIVWGGNGKRIHIPDFCNGCKSGSTIHNTVISRPCPGESFPRILPWKQNNGAQYLNVS